MKNKKVLLYFFAAISIGFLLYNYLFTGIEYGMMESFAEGLELLKGKEEFNLDIAQITELWRHGSVVRSNRQNG